MKRRRNTRQNMRPDERRQQLLDAAITVFARKGYRRASVADVIATAGVARGTFYLYFPGKTQIFLAIVEDFHGRVKQAFVALDDAARGAQADGPCAVLEASFREWLHFFAAHRDQTRVVLREAAAIDPAFERGYAALRQAALTRFSARFARFQQLGAARRTLDPTLVAGLQLGMFEQVLNWVVLHDDRTDIDALALAIADFEWNGIRPDRHA